MALKIDDDSTRTTTTTGTGTINLDGAVTNFETLMLTFLILTQRITR